MDTMTLDEVNAFLKVLLSRITPVCYVILMLYRSFTWEPLRIRSP